VYETRDGDGNGAGGGSGHIRARSLSSPPPSSAGGGSSIMSTASPGMSMARNMKDKMKAVAKKLKQRSGRVTSIAPSNSGELTKTLDATGAGGWHNPDSWDVIDPAVAAQSPQRREASREAVSAFVQIMQFYCDVGEVRFSRGVFRDLCKLLRVVVSSCDAGLQKAQARKSFDTNSSADDDTEMGVAVCWSCGEVNRANYAQCAACSEPPLGAGMADGDDLSSLTEDRHKGQPCTWMHEPKGEEKAYFDVMKRVVSIGSALCSSSSEGFALQQFSVEKEGWVIWSRYDFWQYCIFSDYCDKARLSAMPKDPLLIPAYPDLFPLAAFYLNAMVSIHLPSNLAVSFLARLPFEATIRETLSQLSYRLYESQHKNASSSSIPVLHAAGGSGGVRVMNRSRFIESRKNAALHLSRKASQDLPMLPKRPPPPNMGPTGGRRASLTEDEIE
jgi:hypothetical protein